MTKHTSQKEMYEYLLANPLNVAVHIGDLDDMQGNDYIFLDFVNDEAILRDNDAYYQTIVQISVLTRNYEDRKTLTKYIQNKYLSAPTYSRYDESQYYQAQFTFGVLLRDD